MTTIKKAAVAVSGGMDSLYAMLSLKSQGYSVLALHARLHAQEVLLAESLGESARPPISKEPLTETEERLAKLCHSLDVPLHFIDLREPFQRLVIQPFVESWASGQTPNPCALCNRRVKFGLLQDYAFSLGAEFLATGHYARLLEAAPLADYFASQGLNPPDGKLLAMGLDQNKDQSYFLSLTPRERLSKALFPLGDKIKSELRAFLAAEGHEVPAPTESQEICFIPDDDYKAFLQVYLGKTKNLKKLLGGPGPIIHASSGRQLGEHQGLWRYTQGQRRGLGVSFHEPLYVLGKDMARNCLLVDTRSAQSSCGVRTAPVNIQAPLMSQANQKHFANYLALLSRSGGLWVKTRYRQKAAPVQAKLLPDGGLHIEYCKTAEATQGLNAKETDNLYAPAAPGQVATLYAALPPGFTGEKFSPNSLLEQERNPEDFYVLAAGVITKSI